MSIKMSMNDDQLDQVTGGTIIPYAVSAGDSIDMIAKKFHVDKDLLKKWNGLTDSSVLQVGDQLKIYF